MVGLYLVGNDVKGQKIANSIVITYFGEEAEFLTSYPNPTDKVYNTIAYNYGNGDLKFGNPDSTIINCFPDTNPLFTEAALPEQEFDISSIMEKAFLPKMQSPVVDNGDNLFVSGIETDIIGNPRIYYSGLVDIGPYEVQVHQLTFTSKNVKSIFQDKLRIDYINKRFTPVESDGVYTDLWNQFVDNPDYKEEFIRESKVIIELKTVADDIKFSTDKRNIELARFEAYYDKGLKSIIISKTDENLGGLLSSIFEDGRYVFYFDEVEHVFIVYINPTYDKSKSGKSNIVNEVRIGGSSVINQ